VVLHIKLSMVADKRFIHLGLDVIVGLGTPLNATVAESGYESGEGNYGGYVLLKHESPYYETFYSSSQVKIRNMTE